MNISEPTLYIIDGDHNFVEALLFFANQHNFPSKTFNSAEAFLAEYVQDWNGCILMDLQLPNMSGIELFKEMKRLKSSMPVIIITRHGNIQSAVTAMNEGVFYFLEKPIDYYQLLGKITKAIEINRSLLIDRFSVQEIQQKVSSFTIREREVFDHIISGYTNKVIAARLKIADKTVEAHRSSIMKKTESQSLADLISINQKLYL